MDLKGLAAADRTSPDPRAVAAPEGFGRRLRASPGRLARGLRGRLRDCLKPPMHVTGSCLASEVLCDDFATGARVPSARLARKPRVLLPRLELLPDLAERLERSVLGHWLTASLSRLVQLRISRNVSCPVPSILDMRATERGRGRLPECTRCCAHLQHFSVIMEAAGQPAAPQSSGSGRLHRVPQGSGVAPMFQCLLYNCLVLIVYIGCIIGAYYLCY